MLDIKNIYHNKKKYIIKIYCYVNLINDCLRFYKTYKIF